MSLFKGATLTPKCYCFHQQTHKCTGETASKKDDLNLAHSPCLSFNINRNPKVGSKGSSNKTVKNYYIMKTNKVTLPHKTK